MAEKDIVSTEMKVEDMEKILAGVSDKQEKPDEKGVKPVSPAAVKATEPVLEEKDGDPETIEEAKARIKGLQAELTRKKGQSEKVEKLEGELAYMKGQLDTLSKSKGTQDEVAEAISKWDDEMLVERKGQWIEEVASLRGKFDRAEEAGDQEAMQTLGGRITNARRILKAVQTEERAREDNKRNQFERTKDEGTKVETELNTIFNAVCELHPDFENKESDLWLAGQEQFNLYPVVMEKLGPAAQVVAAALAVIAHPELVQAQDKTDARKEVLKNIDKGLSTALSVGTRGNPGGKPAAQTVAVDTAEGLAAFNRMVDKVKGN